RGRMQRHHEQAETHGFRLNGGRSPVGTHSSKSTATSQGESVAITAQHAAFPTSRSLSIGNSKKDHATRLPAAENKDSFSTIRGINDTRTEYVHPCRVQSFRAGRCGGILILRHSRRQVCLAYWRA